MATVIDQSTMLGVGSSLSLNGSTFQVGVQTSISQLKSAASLSGVAGVSVSNGTVTIKTPGTVLDGYDLRDMNVVVVANDVTIKNSQFTASGEYYTVYQDKGVAGLTVENCTFDGQKADGAGTIISSYNGAMTVRNNEFFNIPSDAVNIQNGTVERNYFSGAGYQAGAHADAISVQSSTGPVTIRENYIDFVQRADAQIGTNSDIKIVSHFGAIDNVTVHSNVLLGGGYSIYCGDAGNPVSNVKITDNDIGHSQWGDLYPGDHGSGFVFQSNSDFSTAAQLLTGGNSIETPSAPSVPVTAPPAATTPPSSTTVPAVGTSEITLRVSGDQYQGSPHLNVSVDGKVVATNLSATAVHSNGEWTDLKVAADLALGSHQVSVTFTDDAWGGSAATDKNLYVDYIDVNGTRYEGESVAPNAVDSHAAVLWSNGSLTFKVDGATAGSATPTSSASTSSDTAPQPTTSIPSPVPASSTSNLTTATISGSDKQDFMDGTASADVIYGKGGSDVISAKAGNDIIVGGIGKDWMAGGAGDDVFVYTSIADSKVGAHERDEICDWGTLNGAGRDKIDLHLIDANLQAAGHQAFSFIGANSFSGAAGELRYYYDGSHTIVEGNINADTTADFQIQINGKVALAVADLIL